MTRELRLDPIGASFSLKEHIYAVLKSSLMELDIYHPETNLRLDERSLAEQLGISRTPIREAIMRLEQEGFVEIQARRGVFIKRKSLEEILEMITVWAALESMAARLACEEATDSAIAELRLIGGRYTAEMARERIGEYSEANIAFHLAVLRLGGCQLLGEMAEGLFTHLKAVRRRALADADRAEESVADHLAIIEAIEARDADRASRLVREHTLRLRDYLKRSWKPVAGSPAQPTAAPVSRPKERKSGGRHGSHL